MSKYTLVIWSFIATAIILPSVALAGPIIRSGDSVVVEADQVLEGDFYGLGGTVLISGSANGDVYVAGGSVTVNAPIAEDLVVGGGTVQVHAPVTDDVRVLGGEVVIADTVSGDVVVLGGVLNILSTAHVEGDILFMGGDLDISGNIDGSVIATAERVRIDAGVGGDVSVKTSGTLTLGDRAEVLGNVEYQSLTEIARAQGAVVVGDIQRTTQSENVGAAAYASLIAIFILLFAALTLYLLFKPSLQRLVDNTGRSYGIQGLVGLGVILGVPFVSFVLIASVLGSIVGAVLLIAYALLLLVTWVVTGIVIGSYILKPVVKSAKVTLVTVIVGVVLFGSLGYIPYIGLLLVLAAFLITLGGMSIRLYNIFR